MQSAKVLLINDDEALREILAETIAEWGFEIRAAEHGKEAIDILAAGFTPHLILLDLVMPVMPGRVFVQWLKASMFASIPVVVLSCTSQRQMADIASEVAEVLDMPMGLDRIRELLDRYCGQSLDAPSHP